MGTWRKWLNTLLGIETEISNTTDPPKPLAISPDAREYYYLFEIQKWISKNVSPYAWDRIALRLYREIVQEKISPLSITPDTKVSASLLLRIYEELHGIYGVLIPSEIIRQAETTKEITS